MESKFKFLAEEMRRDIESLTNKAGLLCRVFARGKSEKSLNEKLHQQGGLKYSPGGRLIQDAIGIRVALYFQEDVNIVTDLLSSHFDIIPESTTIDSHGTDQFTVTRHNLVLRIPSEYHADMSRCIGIRPVSLRR